MQKQNKKYKMQYKAYKHLPSSYSVERKYINNSLVVEIGQKALCECVSAGEQGAAQCESHIPAC